jgi:hypothetical protein
MKSPTFCAQGSFPQSVGQCGCKQQLRLGNSTLGGTVDFQTPRGFQFGQLCSEGLTRFFRHPGQATNYVSQLLDLPYLRAAKSDCDHGDASTASDIVWVVATLASTCCQSRARSVRLSRLAHEFNRAEMADGRVLANRVAEVAYFLGCETNGPNLTLRACQESTALID